MKQCYYQLFSDLVEMKAKGKYGDFDKTVMCYKFKRISLYINTNQIQHFRF